MGEGYLSAAQLSMYQSDITRLDFCVALHDMLAIECPDLLLGYPDEASPFSDIDSYSVTRMYRLGVVAGIGGGLFNPYGEITRQEAAVMLRRAAIAAGVEEGGADPGFGDMGIAAEWAVDAIGFMAETGIMRGTGGNLFSPLGTYTREQAYVTIVRLARIVSAMGQEEGADASVGDGPDADTAAGDGSDADAAAAASTGAGSDSDSNVGSDANAVADDAAGASVGRRRRESG